MPYQHEHAARIESPKKFVKSTFRSKSIRKGVRLIVAKKCRTCSMQTQAVRFNNCVFTARAAQTWLRKHGFRVRKFERASRKCGR